MEDPIYKRMGTRGNPMTSETSTLDHWIRCCWIGTWTFDHASHCRSCGRWPYAPVAPDGYFGPTGWLHVPAHFGASVPEVECQGDTSRPRGNKFGSDHWQNLQEHIGKPFILEEKSDFQFHHIPWFHDLKKELYWARQILALRQCFSRDRVQGIQSWPIIPFPE